SLVTPSAVSPFTPAPTNKSITRLRLCRSRSPPAVKGVGSTEYTPSSFICLLFSATVTCKRLLHKETRMRSIPANLDCGRVPRRRTETTPIRLHRGLPRGQRLLVCMFLTASVLAAADLGGTWMSEQPGRGGGQPNRTYYYFQV